jgi:hypothetical protein
MVQSSVADPSLSFFAYYFLKEDLHQLFSKINSLKEVTKQ